MSKKKRLTREAKKAQLAALREERTREILAGGGDPLAREAMEDQRQRFVAKFGREPGPEDPIFFDPTKDEPTPMTEAQAAEAVEAGIEVMFAAGFSPRFIYAYARLGTLVTTENRSIMDPDDLAVWDGALKEFDRMAPEQRATALQAIRSRAPQ